MLGAAGFIPASSPAETVGEVVAAVLKGGAWFPPLTSNTRNRTPHSPRGASDAQRFRVLPCLAHGLLNTQSTRRLPFHRPEHATHDRGVTQRGNRPGPAMAGKG